MLERDLERASVIHAAITNYNEMLRMHSNLRQHMELYYALPRKNVVDKGPEVDNVLVYFSLQLDENELNNYVGNCIYDFIEGKIDLCRSDLRELGVEMAEDKKPTKPKKPMKLLTAPKKKNGDKQ